MSSFTVQVSAKICCTAGVSPQQSSTARATNIFPNHQVDQLPAIIIIIAAVSVRVDCSLILRISNAVVWFHRSLLFPLLVSGMVSLDALSSHQLIHL